MSLYTLKKIDRAASINRQEQFFSGRKLQLRNNHLIMFREKNLRMDTKQACYHLNLPY